MASQLFQDQNKLTNTTKQAARIKHNIAEIFFFQSEIKNAKHLRHLSELADKR